MDQHKNLPTKSQVGGISVSFKVFLSVCKEYHIQNDGLPIKLAEIYPLILDHIEDLHKIAASDHVTKNFYLKRAGTNAYIILEKNIDRLVLCEGDKFHIEYLPMGSVSYEEGEAQSDGFEIIGQGALTGAAAGAAAGAFFGGPLGLAIGAIFGGFIGRHWRSHSRTGNNSTRSERFPA